MKVLKSKGGIIIYQIVLYEEESPYISCLACQKLISKNTHGLVTIVEEGHPWCFSCGVERLKKVPELREHLLELGEFKKD